MADDTLLDRPIDMEVDLVVLAAAIQPKEDTNRTRKLFGVSCSSDGWLLEAHPKLNPCGTTTAGVFLAGACQAPEGYPGHGSICRRCSICSKHPHPHG